MYLYGILMSDNVEKSIRDNMYYILDLIPEIENMIGFDQKNPHHHLDVWEHTLYALSISEKDYEVRLSLLLHDIGKPFSYQDKDVRHFGGHQEVSSNMSRVILRRLGYNKEFVDKICNYNDEKFNELINNKDIIRNARKEECQ